ncbi:hypothetical protein A5790_02790 [Mycobacterium sp. 852002-51152_SCH6134967]|uniref:hypothetical protein n=1 Tax=Mycobacterium sp. 852002-51152_SCH6134967 TaxID=1834096 RepID=UPI0007FFF81A|nr:hypothetical protein [Mycobacterium sp. 852002-51152_SCH6134967]OBF98675.1 hypothetical protein A5790_02790 [Mycobacterium sp. 852002-51152_SCH6134967]
MPDFSRLSKNWTEWSAKMGMANVSVSPSLDHTEIGFTSDDQSFYLRQEDGWWTVDVVNDRGRRYNDIAKLSTFDLAEIFLVWRWGSTMRDVLGRKMFDPELYSLGRSEDVVVLPTANEWIFELQSGAGRAHLAEPDATIFSHLMSKSVDEVEQMVEEGIT